MNDRNHRMPSDFLKNGAQVMGILNVTPDSFSDGGLYYRADDALERAHQMLKDGASIIDIGGESSRPGSLPVDADEQLRRVLPAIESISSSGVDHDVSPLISVDTTLSRVAQQAVSAGASWVNDITAGQGDPEMFPVVAQMHVPIILMHMQGTPRTMQQSPSYHHVVDEVLAFLESRIDSAICAGIDEEKILIDPGIGFGKSREHNLELINSLGRFVATGFPVVLGCSRKRFMGRICNEEDPKALLGSTVATTAFGVLEGVKVFRVHDVKPNRQAIDVIQAVANVSAGTNKRQD